MFVSVLVNQGDELAAVLLATAKVNQPYFPAGEWVNALAHPDADHHAGLARLDRWAAEYHFDYASEVPVILLAFGAYERLVKSTNLRLALFSPDAREFRRTAYFKQYVHDLGIENYWRKHGFPPACRVLDKQDFACD